MTIHAYTPKFDGINCDGKQLPGRDPVTGRFVASTPDVHDPAWHDQMTHIKTEKEFYSVEEIPPHMMLESPETEDEMFDRIFGYNHSDPAGDDDYFFDSDPHHYDKYAEMAARYDVEEDDDYTTVDDYVENEVVVCTLNGEEISPADAEDIFYGMMFDNYTVPTGQSVPSFYGVNRTRVGQITWWDVDHKDHKTWVNRRRGTGIDRAPKWQKVAGGRKKARQSIKTLPIEDAPSMDLSEVLNAHDAVMQ